MEVNEYTKWLIKQADENRANMTLSEKRTEDVLKIMGIDYKAQTPIMVGPNLGYIADFTFNDRGYNIILEIDGSSHIGSKKKDTQRTRDLRKKGWNVIRIKNEDTYSYSHLRVRINGLLGKFRRKDIKVKGLVKPKADDGIANIEVTDTINDGYVETKGIVFFEEYFNYMDDMTPEQYYQFMGLIRDLRFSGADTDPNLVEDKIVRLAWRAVRPSVLKSTMNAGNYEKRNSKRNE